MGFSHNDSNEFFWWKKVISFTILLMQLDRFANTGSAIALFIVTAKALDITCIHFTNSIRDTQKTVTRTEVIQGFLMIRKAFSIVNHSLGPLLLIVVIMGNLGTCTNFVWAFKDSTISTLAKFGTFNFIIGFMYFIFISARASSRLSMLVRFLSIPDPSCRNRSFNILLKNIVTHEISTGNVGLKPWRVFVITFDFIAGMMIMLLSNAAMVLQNFGAIIAKRDFVNAEIDKENMNF
ncbi:unnamed protein product [Orchesella dallaii]|uniref:Uncharacterized protein n=1 Tax=Orchesella dallaii TaxID=48710 RepID=A0ABP1S717_9HEXA